MNYIRNETLADQVYEKLKNEILFVEIKPGSILTENDISAKYDISRSTVRSVFQKLKDDGLITAIPYKLSYVSQLNMNNILEVIYLRIAIESTIMRDFIDAYDEHSINRLKENVEKQYQAMEEKNFLEFSRLDTQFHKIMFESLDKLQTWNTLQKAELSYTRFKVLDLITQGNTTSMHEDHKVLLNIILNKDLQGIESAYKKHLYSGLRRLRDSVFSSYEEYFTEDTNESCLKKIDAILEEVYG